MIFYKRKQKKIELVARPGKEFDIKKLCSLFSYIYFLRSRLRDADRFWFENDAEYEVMAEDEIAYFRDIKLSDVIRQTTGIDQGEIQASVFEWQNGDPCPQVWPLTHFFCIEIMELEPSFKCFFQQLD